MSVESQARRWALSAVVVLLVLAAGAAFLRWRDGQEQASADPVRSSDATHATVGHGPSRAGAVSGPAAKRRPAAPIVCRTNRVRQLVVVSIRSQHAWMCSGARQVYASAVTTGATALGNGTPTGTWRLQAKQTDRWLTLLNGDSYHVRYWMPYDGVYGFHDSAWQKFAYGSPRYRTEGSHGCVHLPQAAMRWLYHWMRIGATVTIRA